MARIFWSQAEKEAVAKRAAEIRNYSSFEESDIEAVRQAMAEQLADDKQRNLKSMLEVPWVYDMWRDYDRGTTLGSSTLVQQTANGGTWIAPREIPKVHQAIQPIVNPQVEKDSFPEPTPAEILKQTPTLDLWTELGKRINQLLGGEHLRQIIRTEVSSVLERRLPGILAPDDSPVVQPEAAPMEIKLKVCIIGLLNGQQDLIKREYQDRVSFVFFDKSPSFSKVHHTALHYDHVVQMIKYSDRIKGVKQISNYHQIGGLLTQLREFLDRHLG